MPNRRTQLAIASALIAVMVCELAARALDIRAVQVVAWIAMATVTALCLPRLGFRERYLLGLCAALALAVVLLSPDPQTVLAGALDQASFLMAFILLLGLLHEGASTSRAISELGGYLTGQPPGRRYIALTTGTSLLGVLFNIGVLSFLTPLVQRGIARATPDDPLNPIRERRQISAMLRGFAWVVIWSPTAIAPLVVAELIDGVDRARWILNGLWVYAVMLAIGWAEDRIRFRTYRPRAARTAPPFPARAALSFVGTCALLFGMTWLAVLATGESIIFGLMMVSPILLAGWFLVQNDGNRKATSLQLVEIFDTRLVLSAPVAVTLAASGFIGKAAAALLPAQDVADALHLDLIPDFLLLAAIPAAISLLSLLAVSPIMTAVFFGSLFGALEMMPADPTLIAFSIGTGWALSMTFSPFATVNLLVERVSGIKTTTLSFKWNLTYSLLTWIALVPIFAFLTAL